MTGQRSDRDRYPPPAGGRAEPQRWGSGRRSQGLRRAKAPVRHPCRTVGTRGTAAPPRPPSSWPHRCPSPAHIPPVSCLGPPAPPLPPACQRADHSHRTPRQRESQGMACSGPPVGSQLPACLANVMWREEAGQPAPAHQNQSSHARGLSSLRTSPLQARAPSLPLEGPGSGETCQRPEQAVAWGPAEPGKTLVPSRARRPHPGSHCTGSPGLPGRKASLPSETLTVL